MRLIRSWMSQALALCVVVSLVGCGTILRGTQQEVEIISNPPGARITPQGGGQTQTTPAKFELPRRRSQTFVVEMDGYETATVDITSEPDSDFWNYFIADFTWGLGVGLAVDGLSGTRYRLMPTTVFLDLESEDL